METQTIKTKKRKKEQTQTSPREKINRINKDSMVFETKYDPKAQAA